MPSTPASPHRLAGPEPSPPSEARTPDASVPVIGLSRSPVELDPNDSRKDHDAADGRNIDRAQDQRFLTGSRLHLVSTAFGIANIMVALDSSILGKGKEFPIH